MTSYTRTRIGTSKSFPYTRISGPYYIDPEKGSELLPLSYKNGVLDIADVDGARAFSNTLLMDVDVGLYNTFLYRFMGGEGLVTKLGPNFVSYIKRWRSSLTAAPVTSVALHIPGSVTKVQRSRKDALFTGAVYSVSTRPQTSDFYIDGSEENSYRVSWVFKRPLTIRTVEDGVTKYIVFNTTLY